MRRVILAALLVANTAFAGDEIVGFAAYQNGDYSTAYPYLMKSAREGNPEAMYLIGRMFQYGEGVTKNYTEAINWYQKSADKNNPLAQLSLGFMYDLGKGVKQNFPEAFKWYMKSAKQGNAIAQRNIGLMYVAGDGVKENKKQHSNGSKNLQNKDTVKLK